MNRLLKFAATLLLAGTCWGQTHVFPATDTNNIFTGTNSFLGATNFTGATTAGSFNSIRWVDGTQFTTCDAAIADLGSNKGLVVIPSTYAGANCTIPFAENISVWDLRGGTFPAIRTDTMRGFYWSYNGNAEGANVGLSIHGGHTNPTLTDSTLLATSKYSGTLPNATLAAATFENDIVGAVTPGTGVISGHEDYTAIRSTGGTIADVRGSTASVNLDLNTSTTNVTNASSVFANAPNNSAGAASTIVNAYSLQTSQPTVGTTRNYSAFFNGSVLMPNNVNFDVVNSSGTAARFITFNLDNTTAFRPRGTDQLGEFQWTDTGATIPIMTAGTTGGSVQAGVCVSNPSFAWHVECAKAGNIIAKFKNTSATGFGASFVPGLDTNYGIAVKNVAETRNTFSVTGNGIEQDAGGFKHKRFSSPLGGSCPTSATINTQCTSAALAWTTAFADANYTVTCTLSTPTGVPILSTYGSKLAASFTLTISNATAAAANAGADCIAVHDP